MVSPCNRMHGIQGPCDFSARCNHLGAGAEVHRLLGRQAGQASMRSLSESVLSYAWALLPGPWALGPCLARGGEAPTSPEDQAAMEAEAGSEMGETLRRQRAQRCADFSLYERGEEALCRRSQGCTGYRDPFDVLALCDVYRCVSRGSTLVWLAAFNGHRLPHPDVPGSPACSLQSGR